MNGGQQHHKSNNGKTPPFTTTSIIGNINHIHDVLNMQNNASHGGVLSEINGNIDHSNAINENSASLELVLKMNVLPCNYEFS